MTGFLYFGRFSVSKCIHLNGGDAGLRWFFECIYAALVPCGAFVLKAQPRKSYVKACKLHPVGTFTLLCLWWIECASLMQTLQENTQSLQIWPEGFEGVLCSIGFKPMQRLSKPGEGCKCSNMLLRPIEP